MGARRRGGNVSIGLMDLSDLAYVDDELSWLDRVLLEMQEGEDKCRDSSPSREYANDHDVEFDAEEHDGLPKLLGSEDDAQDRISRNSRREEDFLIFNKISRCTKIFSRVSTTTTKGGRGCRLIHGEREARCPSPCALVSGAGRLRHSGGGH